MYLSLIWLCKHSINYFSRRISNHKCSNNHVYYVLFVFSYVLAAFLLQIKIYLPSMKIADVNLDVKKTFLTCSTPTLYDYYFVA